MSQIPPASGSPYGPSPYGPGDHAGGNAPSMGVPAHHAPYAPPGNPVDAPAPYGTGLPRATVKSTRGPVVLLTIGIILVVAAVVALGFAISSVAGVADSLNEIKWARELAGDPGGERPLRVQRRLGRVHRPEPRRWRGLGEDAQCEHRNQQPPDVRELQRHEGR